MTINLNGKTILITREASAAQHFAQKIQTYGGYPIVMPLLEIRCRHNISQQLKKVALSQFEWVFFTSVNGVGCFFKKGFDVSHCRIAAVGPKTAKAIKDFGYEVDFMPTIYDAKTMAKEFFEQYAKSGRALFVRGNLASSVLIEAFTKASRPYECIEVYETIVNSKQEAQLRTVLIEETIDFLTFTSPSTIDAFIQVTKGEQAFKQLRAVCIGTTTAAYAKEVGFTETIVPDNFTIEGMIKAMDQVIKRSDL